MVLDYGSVLALTLDRLMSADVLAGLVFGTLLGYIFGMIPGLQSVTAMVILLPFTFSWDPIVAMYVFAGIIGAAGRGGSISSIALNMPGTVVNAATTLDGYPLAKQGKAAWALGIAAGASLFGALFGIAVLILSIPVFAPFLMAFGPVEVFWIIIFGFITLAFALPGSFIKGMVAVGIGILLAAVGLGGPAFRFKRFTFGSNFLENGLDLVVVVIALLVVSEAIKNLVDPPQPIGRNSNEDPTLTGKTVSSWKEGLAGFLVPLRYPALLMRSSLIGTFIGAIPGVGGSVAQFFSYNAAYATSKAKEKFGHGSEEGLLACEAAVDAKEGGTVLPTLMFGIPGNAEMALVLVAWVIHGLRPGIFFLREHPEVAFALILGLLLSNILATILQVLSLPLISRIPNIRGDFVAVAVLVLSVLAALSVKQSPWDAVFVILIGLFGFLMKGFGFPVIGIAIGFLLGGPMESNLYSGLQSGYGEVGVLFSGPIALTLAAGTVVILLLEIRRLLYRFVSRRVAEVRGGGS